MRKLALLLLPLLFFVGCTNPYSQFYKDYTDGIDITENPKVIISTDEPRLIEGTNITKDAIEMLENGYALLGESSFNAATINQNLALQQAKKNHADTVLVYSQYTNTVSGSMPLTVPDTQTSTGFHSGSIYGSGGGFANYSGSSYTTTYGSRTTYTPYNRRMYDYYASFWAKSKPPRLGVHFNDLTDEHRRKIESNKGVYVIVVVRNSPAFKNDLLSGDIIRKVNDVEIIDKIHFQNLLKEIKNQKMKLTIFRNDRTIEKEIQLN